MKNSNLLLVLAFASLLSFSACDPCDDTKLESTHQQGFRINAKMVRFDDFSSFNSKPIKVTFTKVYCDGGMETFDFFGTTDPQGYYRAPGVWTAKIQNYADKVWIDYEVTESENLKWSYQDRFTYADLSELNSEVINITEDKWLLPFGIIVAHYI